MCSGSSGRLSSSQIPPFLTSHTTRCWSSSPCSPPRGLRPVWTGCLRWRPVCGRWGWRTCCEPRRCEEAARCWRRRRRRRRRWGAWRSAARTARSRSRAAGGPEHTRAWRGRGRRTCLERRLCAGVTSTVTCHSPQVWSLLVPASWTDWSGRDTDVDFQYLWPCFWGHAVWNCIRD